MRNSVYSEWNIKWFANNAEPWKQQIERAIPQWKVVYLDLFKYNQSEGTSVYFQESKKINK